MISFLLPFFTWFPQNRWNRITNVIRSFHFYCCWWNIGLKSILCEPCRTSHMNKSPGKWSSYQKNLPHTHRHMYQRETHERERKKQSSAEVQVIRNFFKLKFWQNKIEILQRLLLVVTHLKQKMGQPFFKLDNVIFMARGWGEFGAKTLQRRLILTQTFFLSFGFDLIFAFFNFHFFFFFFLHPRNYTNFTQINEWTNQRTNFT